MMQNVSTQALPQAPNEATILLNVGTNDPTRGDVAGWRGMARGMAAKTGARVVYADDKTVRSAFDNDQDTPYEELLAKYIEEFNPPEAVFGHSCHETLRLLGQDPDDVYEMTRINEGITSDLLGENELVAHHLTSEVLEEEGKLFDTHHPKIKKPIITVMLQDPYGEDERQKFAERIVKLMSHYPEATIYLCGSRHTTENYYDDLKDRIKREAKKQKVSKKIDVAGYKFDREAKYNPYKGLIARSKHIVVWASSSQSLVSEALFSGKTVYLYGTYGYEKTKKKKLATDFNELALDEPPLSREFEPFNLTDQLVEKLVEQKNEKDNDVDKRVLQRAERRDHEEWDKHLRAIRRNYKAAALVPDALKKDPEFVRAALKIRGFSLSLFPDFRDDREMVAIALGQNQNAIKFIGKTLQGLKGFMQDLMNSVNSTDAFAGASEELRADPAFAMLALNKDRSAFAHVADALKKDPKFIRDLVREDLIAPSDIPAEIIQERGVLLQVCARTPHVLQEHDKYINDAEFAAEAIQGNPTCYKYFGHDVRKLESIAVAAISQDPSLYQNVPSDQQGNKGIVKAYLSADGDLEGIDLKNLDDEMMREVMPLSPNAMAYASEALRNDIDLARVVMDADITAVRHFSDEVRDNRALIRKMLEEDPTNFAHCGPKTRDNFKIVKAALLKKPAMISECSERLQRNPALLKAFIAKHPSLFRTLPEHSKSVAGIEAYAFKKDPNNLRLCSAEYRNNPDLIEEIISHHPEHFRHLTEEAISDPGNICRVYKTKSEAVLNGATLEAIASNPALFDELIKIGPKKSNRMLMSELRYYDNFMKSRKMVLTAIEHDPDLYITSCLGMEAARNADFMRQVAAIPGVEAEHFRYVDFLDEKSAKAMIEVRPEFLENENLRQIAFSRYSYRRLDKAEQKEARRAARFKPVAETVKAASSGVKRLQSAFAGAVGGHASSKKEEIAVPVPQEKEFKFTLDEQAAFKKDIIPTLEKLSFDESPYFEPASPSGLKIKKGFHDIGHYEGLGAFPQKNKRIPPAAEVRVDGQKYKLVETASPRSVGIRDDLKEALDKDLSDDTRYPDASIVRLVEGASDEVSIYAPIKQAAEHHTQEGTICEHHCTLSRQYVEQVGQDVWVRTNTEDDPLVIKNAVIAPVSDSPSLEAVGIYTRTERKIDLAAQHKKDDAFKKGR